VTLAPLHVASLARHWPLASAPFACATVENHISALVREFMLEVQIVFWLGARHDEDQVCHDRLPPDSRRCLISAGIHSERAAGTPVPLTSSSRFIRRRIAWAFMYLPRNLHFH